MRHFLTPLLAIALLIFPAPAQAHPTIHYAVRDLTALAEAIVVADIVETPNPSSPYESSFKVVEVLFGKNIAIGDTIKLLYSAAREKNPAYLSEPTPKVTRALLYLHSTAERAKHVGMDKTALAYPFSLVTSGQRYLSADNLAWTPLDGVREGITWQKHEATWEKLLDHARAETKSFSTVKDLIATPGSPARNKSLFDWIAQHQSEFEIGKDSKHRNFNRSDFDTHGWGDLEQAVFEALGASGIPEDAWNARLQFNAIIGTLVGYETRLDSAEARSYSTKLGRKFLLARSADMNITAQQRLSALQKINALALYPRFGGMTPVEATTPDERAAILLELLKPLADPSAPVRGAAAECIVHVFAFTRTPDRAHFGRPAFDALAQAYKKEPPGSVRSQLVEALFPLCTEAEWKDLTGNAGKLLVTIRVSHKSFKPTAYVTLTLTHNGPVQPAFTPPRFKADRLDAEGRILRTHTFSFAENLTQSGSPRNWCLEQRVPLVIEAGAWRIYATGTSGENNVPWTSEAFSFDIKE